MELNEQVVLITGATGGLGQAVTGAFLSAGARVAGVSRKVGASDFPHPNFVPFPAELSNGRAAAALVESVVATMGRIDALVHLVGAFAGGESVAETDEAILTQMFEVNVVSSFRIFQAVLPHLRERGQGRILAIGSRVALEPAAMAGAYASSKAALVSLVRTVAVENQDRGITANIVLPGTMDTLANRAAMPGADSSRWVHPQQVAALLVYLASPAASQVNGTVIPVYGADV